MHPPAARVFLRSVSVCFAEPPESLTVWCTRPGAPGRAELPAPEHPEKTASALSYSHPLTFGSLRQSRGDSLDSGLMICGLLITARSEHVWISEAVLR